MATFSERLKLLRKRAGLTQTQLAEKMEFKPGAVGNWESGANPPSRESLRKLAGILGTTEMFLSGESDIDSFTYSEEAPEYKAALFYEKMTSEVLEFIFESHQKELADPDLAPKRKREVLGIISEVAAEMQKRIPPGIERELTRKGIEAGDSREVKPKEQPK